MNQPTNSPTKSTNHVEFIGDYEFFTDTKGNLYRTRIANSLDRNGFRMGGRYECPSWMVNEVLTIFRDLHKQHIS